MKKLNQLGRKLSKNQQRSISGGTIAPPTCVLPGGACTDTSQCCWNFLICPNYSEPDCEDGPTACIRYVCSYV